MKKSTVLIVANQWQVAAHISSKLTDMGYDVMGMIKSGEHAIDILKKNRADIVLMDMLLEGTLNGIEAAQVIIDKYRIPVMYLSGNILSAKTEFQSNPKFKDLDKLLTNEEMSEKPDSPTQDEETVDRLFVRYNQQMIKVYTKDIMYIEADRSYCNIHTKENSFLVSSPMRTIEEILPKHSFFKSHRSFIININHIEVIGENKEYFIINDKSITLSTRHKEKILSRIKIV